VKDSTLQSKDARNCPSALKKVTADRAGEMTAMTLEVLAVAAATAEEASVVEAEAAEVVLEVAAAEEATVVADMTAIAVAAAVIITVEAVVAAEATVVVAATKTATATPVEVETMPGVVAIKHGEQVLDTITQEAYRRPQTVGLAHTQHPNPILTRTTALATAAIVGATASEVVAVEATHTSHPALIPTRKLLQFTW
jgi:hypothetical protein